ncbi:unnamed protein product [Eruca vesicaria subsp. sativa]|uniref:Uncharacterized protein n=1 Tax=Eruca vesicaria subsp. sativa TaxID=29727 RepID=A0ABC8KHG8_ERUVS|nr:unnamed protein product [Eruca vesicaria subsp. sativa]
MSLPPLLEEMKALKLAQYVIYPLYYGGHKQTQQVDMSLRVPETPIIIGMPISIKAPDGRTKRFCDFSLKLGVSSSDPPSTRIDVGLAVLTKEETKKSYVCSRYCLSSWLNLKLPKK